MSIRIVIEHVTATVTYELKTDDPGHVTDFFRCALVDHAALLRLEGEGGVRGFMARATVEATELRCRVPDGRHRYVDGVCPWCDADQGSIDHDGSK